MSISSAGNLSRVSTSLKTFTVIQQLQENALRVFREETRISTGNRLLSAGEDPVSAEKITRMLRSLESQDEILSNLRHADGYLATADSTIAEINDLLNESARIASEQASNLNSAEERAAQSVIVDGIIAQLQSIANRTYQGRYLFGGRRIDLPAMNGDFGRVTVRADQGDRATLVNPITVLPFNVLTADLYELRQEVVGGYANFDVQLNLAGRISELAGANLQGVQLGAIEVTEGALTFQVDFTGAETVGDLIARFNDTATTAGSTLTLGINPADGATLSIISGGGAAIQIAEVGQGTTASDLGLEQSVAAGLDLIGTNLNRRPTLTTLLNDLLPGGITLPDGVVITNGSRTATVTFAGATIVQDVLNALNGAGIGIRADITADGNSFFVENLVAGTPLIIGENGGTDADTLGIRSLDPTDRLDRINGGRGIHPVEGHTDIRITDANGVAFEVSLSGAQTISDVLNAINAAATAAGAAITGEVSPSGAGIRLVGPGGPNPIIAESVNLSPVAGELGIAGTGTPTALDGGLVAPFFQSGIFSALYKLRDGLLADDSTEITLAGGRINALQPLVSDIAGQVGARSKDVQDRVFQTENAVASTRALLSELKDVDFVEAVTKFQQAQTALEASLMTGSKSLSLSLLDFLG